MQITGTLRRSCKRGLFGAILATAIGLPAPAAAQISRIGGTVPLLGGQTMRGNDVAHDPVNDVYLVVGGYGAVYGVFTDAAGAPVTSVFAIKPGDSPFGHFPRVKYSPHVSNGAGGAGGFLVTWHQDDVPGSINVVHARIVAYPNRLVGSEMALSNMSSDGATKWEAGAAIAYSTTSQRFLVAWQTVSNAIQGRLVGANGSLIGGVIPIANPGGARDPGVAWNGATDEFGISYTGWDCCGAFAGFVRLRAGDAFLSGRATFGHSGGTYLSDIDVNTATGRFVMAWTNATGTNRAEIDTGSNVLGAGLVSAQMGGYDSLGLAFNPASGTFLAVGQQQSTEVGAIELGANGTPIGGVVTVTAGASLGSFYPRAAARSNAKQWDISLSQNLNVLADQAVATGSGGGPPAPPPPGGLSVNMTASSSFPAPAGTTVTWTASSSGGTAPIQYQFWTYTSSTGWIVGQHYSGNNTFTWTPPAGTNAVQVWARSAGSGAPYDAYTSSGMFTITGNVAQVTSLTANVSFPASAGVPITWTATASGGTAPLQYQFWIYSSSGGMWIVGQHYSTNNTFTWAPPEGTNAVQVWVRSAGSGASYDSWLGSGFFSVVGSGGVRVTSLTANVGFPASPTTPITWTASATGGSVEYQFWMYRASTSAWSILRDWSSHPQVTWTAGIGDTGLHAVQVWVRRIGSSAAFEDWRGTDFFNITDATGLTLTTNRPLTGLRNGDVVVFTAHVSGGSGPWDYRFYGFNGSTWIVLQEYTANQNAFAWGMSPGTRALQVWIRASGSSAPYELWTGTGTFVIDP